MNTCDEEIKFKIKQNIEILINDNELEVAKELIQEYENIYYCDLEVLTMKGIIQLLEGNIDNAIDHFRKGYSFDNNNFDVLYNLGYSYRLKNDFQKALFFYKLSAENCSDVNDKGDICKIIDELKACGKEEINKERKRIVFFDKGSDTFIREIISELSIDYEVKKITVTDVSQIDEGMNWADICWFEWCDELIEYGSKHRMASEKKIICRLHSYEAFTNYINNVNWKTVDKVIFVAEHIRDYVLSQVKINRSKTVVIQNSINIDKFKYKERKCGYKIAYVGYINYKKGPMLLLHSFKAIFERDKRYKLYIAGQFQDGRDILYFNQMIKEFGLEHNVVFDGWQEDLNSWLEDKNYILCTSILESQNISVMQAMCKGIKPIIHNFVGAKEIYPKKYVWNTIGEMVEMIESKDYNSNEYKKFILDNFSFEKLRDRYDEMLNSLDKVEGVKSCEVNEPLVSVCITSYNYSKYIDESIMSVLSQTYKNIELFIIDDFSADGSREKLKEYEKKYENVKCIYNESNKGYKYGIRKFIESLCTGKYFIILSADDAIAYNDTIEKYIQAFEAEGEDLDFIYGDMIIFDEKSKKTQSIQVPYINKDEVIRQTFNRFGSGVLPFLFAVHRSEFYKNNNYSWEEFEECANDTLNCLIAIKHGAKYRKFNYPMFKYRQHGNNDTFNFEGRVRDISAIINYIVKNFEFYIYGDKNARSEKLRLEFLINYYYKCIKFYLHNYKVFGITEVKIPQEQKTLYLKRIIDECMHYVNIYKQKNFFDGNKCIGQIEINIKNLK